MARVAQSARGGVSVVARSGGEMRTRHRLLLAMAERLPLFGFEIPALEAVPVEQAIEGSPGDLRLARRL
ncbi:hypothetical protein DESUT3_14730 [Desulfuromonas versatilis]|uniref:Uncharacterized protein n=1 Tax=Desulfuromonas versatilis TaxID=2802975 RepID=A0ABM8HTP3_9BACT|nr:hypothetical protein DESUT3_14730 [Desulfuromonas versatilis]